MESQDPAPEGLTRSQYAALAAFRFQLRRFLAFSETAAHAANLPAQQHQALLAIAGHDGPEPPTVGVLAERLLIAPHTAAELAARMAEAGLLEKTHAAEDRRRVFLTLTSKADAQLAGLSAIHLQELQARAPELISALENVISRN